MLNSWMFTSKTDMRATPQDFFDKLNDEFKFNLDPCATPENAKCEKYFTKEDDGLSKSRDNQNVFCNPPYWREIKNRVQKAYFTRGGGRYAFTRENGHKPISWFYLEKIRNSLYKMTLEIWLKQKFCTISVNGCYI